MAFYDFMDTAKMSPARRERFDYWRAVPLRRLAFLLLAVFFTFGTIGLLVSIASANGTPLVVGFSWGVFTGVSAICYLVVLARRPRIFPALVPAQLVLNWLWSMVTREVVHRGWFRPLPEHTTVLVFVWTALAFVVLGYTFFLVFIQTEGRQTVRAHTQLALAHGIQETLVPRLESTLAGCEVFGISMPSDKVGGDIVDVVALPDGSFVAYVADVAGHGLQAGILMGMVKTAARTRLLDGPKIDALFASLNRVMPEVKEAHMYATCAALRIGPRGGDGSCPVEFAVAGHPSILRVRVEGLRERGAESCKVDYFSDEQFPLGLFPFAEYRSQTFGCCPGDLLAVMTDGVLEVEAADGSQFGAERVESILRTGMGSELPALASQILAAANGFGRQTDDQTLLLIRVL
jgi:serine phosphatase RsbU (regulator of sigma subunit)